MITSFETQTVHNSLLDALVAQEVERRVAEIRMQEAARTVALLNEIDRLHGLLLMRQGHDARMYARAIADAERDYGQRPHRKLTRRLGDVWWGAVGLLVEGFGEIIDDIKGSAV